MPTYHYTDVNGQQWKCLYPEGRDPLLVAWRAGDYETHHTWTDPDFWRGIAQLAATEHARSMRAHDRKRGRAA